MRFQSGGVLCLSALVVACSPTFNWRNVSLDAAALPPAQLRQRLAERRLPDLRYYNAEVHPALFALPNYYRDLVQPAPLAALPPRAVRVA